MDWQVGDVALCVDDRWYGRSPLNVGERYTVVSVGLGPWPGFSPVDGRCAVRLLLNLLETRNPDNDGGFDARRFIKQPSLIQEVEREVEAVL